MRNRGFSDASLRLPESVTHGTKAKIAELNQRAAADSQVVDLSIGTLDLLADKRIDEGVCDFIRKDPEAVHAFAPVKGFPDLRKAVAERLRRLHGVTVDPDTEVLVTPGGIKGSLTVLFHTFLDPGDVAVIPSPNWPHYADMLHLHRAEPRFVPANPPEAGLTPDALRASLTDETKLVILGDCINPTGKVYSSDELRALALVIATHNVRREAQSKSPVRVIFDCPYEAHVFGERAITFAAIEVDVPGHGAYAMRGCTATVTGPGKTYGMHGDRAGYVWADAETIDVAARVQVNTNSFASTYAQAATRIALSEEMDAVATERARQARATLDVVVERLAKIDGLRIARPDGGYFLFVDFSAFASRYEARGYERADRFLLEEARVATISGLFFAPEMLEMRHFVRLNCGRTSPLLHEACARIERALASLGTSA